MANDNSKKSGNLTRREFVKYFAGTTSYMSFASFDLSGPLFLLLKQKIQSYPIDSTVKTTAERMISFPFTPATTAPNKLPEDKLPPPSPNGSTGLRITELCKVSEYDSKGYGSWKYVDHALPIIQRTDIMPTDYDPTSVEPTTKLLNFCAMSDIHITDKEAPNSFIYLQQQDQLFSGGNTSIYSPIMMYTTQVFDAAIQTANALHKKNPFDFFISLGDACNCTSYNELRWYIDVIDGKVITPSSGAHLGAETIDYQKPFQAAGLDKSIPFYQTIGNHDHFLLGSFPPYETGLADSFTSDTVWSVTDFLVPNPNTFPAMFSVGNMKTGTSQFYTGVINGSNPYGTTLYGTPPRETILNAGPVEEYPTAPKITADPNRRSLLRTEWIHEFFNTTTSPVGHGFNLVSSNPNFNLVPENDKAGFACYSFVPKSDIPLKVIVLDDTQREDDGSVDIHGHGFLDEARWAWLQAELADGQAANQLMIIAAHIPIAVANIATELEWWLGGNKSAAEPKPLGDASTDTQNAVDLKGLVDKLWDTPNLLMWIAGHRHFNTVKAFPYPTVPENGFWQIETSSLHDFPQQFRTFEIYLNSDYTISIETVNVDPAVAEGSPAATSRKYAIAVQQIVQNNLMVNSANLDQVTLKIPGADPEETIIPLPSMDPSRTEQGTPDPKATPPTTYTDPTIEYVDLKAYGIPYNASYNAQLFKQLSPTMKTHMQILFPTL